MKIPGVASALARVCGLLIPPTPPVDSQKKELALVLLVLEGKPLKHNHKRQKTDLGVSFLRPPCLCFFPRKTRGRPLLPWFFFGWGGHS